MPTDNENQSSPREQRREALVRRIADRAARKRKARREAHRGVWFGLGMFGLVGWAVAVPTLIGIAVGAWIDRVSTASVSWTLTGLFVGIVLGCWNAWYWVRREGRHD